jgi:hypothetical protein
LWKLEVLVVFTVAHCCSVLHQLNAVRVPISFCLCSSSILPSSLQLHLPRVQHLMSASFMLPKWSYFVLAQNYNRILKYIAIIYIIQRRDLCLCYSNNKWEKFWISLHFWYFLLYCSANKFCGTVSRHPDATWWSTDSSLHNSFWSSRMQMDMAVTGWIKLDRSCG